MIKYNNIVFSELLQDMQNIGIKVWAFEWKNFNTNKYKIFKLGRAFGKVKRTLHGFVLFFKN